MFTLKDFSNYGKEGCLNLLPLKQVMPELLQNILSDHSKQRDIEDLKHAKINFSLLREFMESLDFDSVLRHIRLIGKLEIDFNDRSSFVENDALFQWDHKYVVVLCSYFSTYQALPTPEQFWQYWLLMNDSAMTYNISVNSGKYKNVYGYRSALSASLMSYNDLTEQEHISRIFKGAKVRAYRFLAAALRELHALLSVTNCGKIFSHPLIDCTCKYDGIIFTEKEAVGVAICLNSDRSDVSVESKAANIPIYFKKELNRGVGVKIKGIATSGVIYADSSELYALQAAVTSRCPRSFINEEYTWAN